MATTFKTFLNNDVVSTRTLLHESIPVTGTIASGTYGTFREEENVRNFSHGMFQSVYDYPYLSSSANHIFDITVGYHSGSSLQATTNEQNNKKKNIYNQMAQVLVGYDTTGSVLQFDQDGNFAAGGEKMNECFFLSFSRLLVKDEVKKGSFNVEFGVSGSATGNLTKFGTTSGDKFKDRITLKDNGAENDYRVNSPAGEYGILYVENSAGSPLNDVTGSTQQKAGLIYYQAGIAVITSSIFHRSASSGGEGGYLSQSLDMRREGSETGHTSFTGSLTGSAISSSADDIRARLYNISFNNTTELNSSIYFCRANHNEFNYSSSPTYLSASKIFVKENVLDTPVSYITTVGLYSADSELLAVAKLSEPLKKDPNTELTLRVRLDY
tara:strand:- start:474 stop:1622 length:1149 start_codon:yes stop_codon:yes gene_type:complete